MGFHLHVIQIQKFTSRQTNDMTFSSGMHSSTRRILHLYSIQGSRTGTKDS